MPTDLQSAVRSFLSSRRIAVAGASRQAGPGSAVFNKFRAAKMDVVPVNPAATTISGMPCFPDLRSIPGGVEAVFIATPPAATVQVVRECVELGIKRVWIHRAIGSGSAAPEATRLCRENGISLIDGACPMMYCQPVDFAHLCARGLIGLFGKLPKPEGKW
jgi:predicted CoA-binding protein